MPAGIGVCVNLQPTTAQSYLSKPALDGARVLRCRTAWQSIDLERLWRFRDLLWILALRDIQVRYKQTILGAAWAILQPLVTMIVLTTFFGRFLGVADKTDGIPYPIFLYAGLLPWTLFTSAVTASSQSLVGNANLLRKVYFPRLLLPAASIGASLIDYAFSFLVLLAMMAWYQIGLTASILLLPLLVLNTIVAALGVGVLLAALTVSYRDFRFVVPFLLQIWFFVTPVVYPVNVLPSWLRELLALNPMQGTIEAFRAVVLGRSIDVPLWSVAAATSILCLMAGVAYFARTERRFADVV